MVGLKSVGGGALLAAGNVYGALSTFVALSILFNSVDLKTFGSISLLLTSVSICQILFSTQSWQGLLNSSVAIGTKLLRRCLAIDVCISVAGALLLLLCHTALPTAFSATPAPAILLLVVANVALAPPGAVIAVIRQDGRFAQQALIDMVAATLKIILALTLLRTATSLLAVALTLVLPELLRWTGYLGLAARRLARTASGGLSQLEDTKKPSPTVRSVYAFSVWGMLTEIIHLPTAHIDKLMVSAILGLESLAIWDILKRCATTVVQGTTVINQMLFPYFVRIRGQQTVSDLTRQCVRHCALLMSLILLLYGVATLTLPLWFPLAFHVDSSAWPLQHLQVVFGLLALVLTFVLGSTPLHPLFLSVYHSSKNFRISFVGNLVFFVSSFLLLPVLGLFGTSLAILSSDAFIIVTKFRLLRAAQPDARQ